MTEIKVARRVQEIPPSEIRRFFDVANEMKGEVYSLSIGEPDFVTPWSACDAGIYSIEQGKTHYSPNYGIIELRRAIADYIYWHYGVDYDSKTEIITTVGGSEGIDIVFRGLVNPGEEVIVPEPSFVAYKAGAKLAGAKVVTVATQAENGFKLTPELLRSALTPQSRLLVVSYPSNPTGAVMNKADWAALLPVLREFPDLIILTDELYTELDYSGEEPSSLIQWPELRDRIFYVGGFSKTYAMTGWRIGYLIGPEYLLTEIAKVHQYTLMCAPTAAQYAALEAITNGEDVVNTMRNRYNLRRNMICAALREMELPVFEPKGAFYIFPNITACGMDSNTFCERFLREEKVAIIPGSAFGDCGEGFARISYAASEETIEEAMLRMHRFVNKYRRR